MQKNTHVRQKKGPPSGFTLVEVIITLVVIAIAAALASPAFLAMAPEMQLRGEAQELFSSIQEAKILAVKENRDIAIRFDTPGFYYIDADGDGAYTLGEKRVFFDEDLNGNGILDDPGDCTGEDINCNGRLDTKYGIGLGTGAAVNDWKGDPCVQAPFITFNSRGTTSAASVYIDNRNNDICYAVTTQIAGSVKIRKFNGTSWIE
jgi:type IV fimbrial biogenesis protein FimT